jgi:hypothetical protein
MSKTVMQQILGRALTDPAFRKKLLTSPESAVSRYELSSRELEQIKGLANEAVVSTLGEEYDRLISKACLGTWQVSTTK